MLLVWSVASKQGLRLRLERPFPGRFRIGRGGTVPRIGFLDLPGERGILFPFHQIGRRLEGPALSPGTPRTKIREIHPIRPTENTRDFYRKGRRFVKSSRSKNSNAVEARAGKQALHIDRCRRFGRFSVFRPDMDVDGTFRFGFAFQARPGR